MYFGFFLKKKKTLKNKNIHSNSYSLIHQYNSIHKTNIPNLRVQYRAEQLVGEFRYLRRLLKMAENSAELDMSLIDHIANTNIDYVHIFIHSFILLVSSFFSSTQTKQSDF